MCPPVLANQRKMAEIISIDKRTVHQICSGQVILDLSIAVKELVENSLDAGASSIEIKLKEFGLEQIEVIDNGGGVEEKNFAALTLKHHTSKLKSFTDLESVETFGFRGEALSSLCGLSDVTICTKHKDNSVGYKIEYDHDGMIKSKTYTARQTGTTVTLRNLFQTLPVRCKELKKNLKKEYGKLLSLLSAYCIISTNVKISCSNQVDKTKKGCIISTQGSDSIQKNISSVFGAKQLLSLKPFKLVEPSAEICDDFNLKVNDKSLHCYQINGFISDVEHGVGRSSPDRQFYFINSRPVDFSRLSKVVNEVYRSYNRHQYPFVVLNIRVQHDDVDVNVTPNKRQVFVHNEKILLCIIKASLLHMYSQQDSSVIGSVKQTNILSTFIQDGAHREKRCEANNVKSVSSVQDKCEVPASAENLDQRASGDLGKSLPVISHEDSGCMSSIDKLSQFKRNNDALQGESNNQRKRSSSLTSTSYPATKVAKQTKLEFVTMQTTQKRFQPMTHRSSNNLSIESGSPMLDTTDTRMCTKSRFDVSKVVEGCNAAVLETDQSQRVACSIDDVTKSDLTSCVDVNYELDVPCTSEEVPSYTNKIKFSLSRLKKRMETHQAKKKIQSGCSWFRARIEPSQNATAENELSRNLDKTAFLQMEVVGQFNLGFIITRYKSDLFIIDQHASDEIYNFESLQQSTQMHSLNLVAPQKLELAPSDQLILMENMSIFQKNGFGFISQLDTDTHRETVYLCKVPSSKDWQFGPRDVDELIFMLSDAPHVMCRPSRVRQMLASRACRKSVMIGTALNKTQMSRLVRHMAEITHPWNCPHGRPTMRHLVDLSKISVEIT